MMQDIRKALKNYSVLVGSCEVLKAYNDDGCNDDKIKRLEIKINYINLLLNELRPYHKDIVYSHYVDEKTYGEIARLYGSKETTIKVTAHRAIRRLSDKMSYQKNKVECPNL